MRTFITLFTALLTLALGAPAASAQTTATDLASAGWQAIQVDDGATALRLFDAAVAARPRDAGSHVGLGAAAHMLGRDDEAMRALTTALHLDPTLAIASRLLAEIAVRGGDLTLAIATYQEALIYAPDDVEIAARLDRLLTESARRAAASPLSVVVAGPRHDAIFEHATRVLHNAYWQAAKLVGAYPAEVITIELNTSRPFRVDRGPSLDPVAFDNRITLDVDGALTSPEHFDRALTGELVRAMVESMAPTGVPPWFAAGLSQIVSTDDAALARRRLRLVGTMPWAQLEVVGAPAAATQVQADCSFLIVRALLARIGAKSTQLLDGLADGQSLDAALAPFGFSYADLKADVVLSLEQ